MDTIRTPSEARKNGPTEFRETEREKTYTYQRDGKTITIKRKWNNSLCGKQQALNKYFETYKDDILSSKDEVSIKIKAQFESFNNIYDNENKGLVKKY